MATFPKLRTQAVAQYPAGRGVRFQNRILQFVDGREQRYRDAGSMTHEWRIQLDHLDEGELADLELFFLSNEGQFGSFSFVDPWDGVFYPSCSLGDDQLNLVSAGTMRSRADLQIVENRS